MSNFKRYAIVSVPNVGDANAVERYLPGNYSMIALTEDGGRSVVVIEGRDNAGWTLDGYVLPRLASGLYFGKEVGLDHPVFKHIPEGGFPRDDEDQS
jgi:hypothetical protein